MRAASALLVASFVLALPLAAPAQPATAKKVADPAARIETKLAPLFRADQPGGTIIVTQGGKTVFRKAYGLADVEGKVPLRPESVLRIGSVTKQFTAAAILLLEQDGKLSIDDDIARYVPEVPKAGVPTTIRHLLTHTSGIVNFTAMATFPAVKARDVTLSEAVMFFKDEPRRFQPGARYEYSNSNYLLLGLIVQRVSGVPYGEFMASRIFEPLGMPSTAYEGQERGGRKRVEGYSKRVGKPFATASLEFRATWAAGAGGLVSSVDDLARWDQAMTAGNLLTPANWKRMATPGQLADGTAIPYGFGMSTGNASLRPAVFHGGWIDGFQSVAVRFPDDGLYVAILLNSTGGVTPTFILDTIVSAYFAGP